MGRYLSEEAAASAAASAVGSYNKRAAYGPYAAGRQKTLVVPAGVTEMVVTGCAQGGSSWATAPTGSVSGTNLVFDGASYLACDSTDYNTGTTRQAFNRHATTDFSSISNLLGRYFGFATGASESGDSFIVSGGTTNNSTIAGLSWSTDGGYSFTTRSVSALATGACAKQVVVADDGRAVVLWSGGSSAEVVLSATKDYGATWTDITATQLGGSTLGCNTVALIDDVFIVSTTTTGVYYSAADPTGSWTAISTGMTGYGCSVAWDGTTYVWASATGKICTSTALTGPYTQQTSPFPSDYLYVVAGASGNFVGHTLAASSTSVARSTDNGVTWTSATTSASAGYANGALVYSPDLGIFIIQSTISSYSYRSPTGATWTSLSNSQACAGRPTQYSHTSQKILYPFPGGVRCGTVCITSASATAWATFNMASVGFAAPTENGVALSVTGSESGSLLTLAGGKGTAATAATAAGANGGGSLLNGGEGAAVQGTV